VVAHVFHNLLTNYKMFKSIIKAILAQLFLNLIEKWKKQEATDAVIQDALTSEAIEEKKQLLFNSQTEKINA
jgi:hypothetical protein